eukprot:gene13135-54419_t
MADDFADDGPGGDSDDGDAEARLKGVSADQRPGRTSAAPANGALTPLCAA